MRTAASCLFLLLTAFPILSAQTYTAVRAFPNLVLVQPIGLVDPGDGSNRLFVVEQPGVIKVFDNHPDVSHYGIFLDLRSKVVDDGELGLLGLAFHPDFKKNGYFYVYYTTPDPLRTIVSRFRVQPDNPDMADSTSETIILTYKQPDRVHKGGQLAFGADGYLYIASGDGGFAGDPDNNAQTRTNLLGKILRIDVNPANTEEPYSIPPDNPYADSVGFRREIYAYGFRNPWRFSFDGPTGRLWAGDVGQDMWEEVDIVQRGRNYGWSRTEGFHCFNPAADCDTAGLEPPIWNYRHDSAGGNAIVGGYVYRGPSVPGLVGKYIYGDFISGRIWALDYNGTSPAVNTLLVDTNFGVSSFGVDSRKELYICSYDGAIYKLAEPAGVERVGAQGAFELEESTPNPVVASAVIGYTIAAPAHVSLTLHDALGREVARVVDAAQGSGRHTVKLDAAGLPGGSYYCRLAAGGRIITRRVVITK